MTSTKLGSSTNNGNNSYTSYIDYIEINGTTFDFEASPPLPPSAPTDLVATPGDGQLDIAFTPAEDNGTAITDYQYQRDGGSWISAGTTRVVNHHTRPHQWHRLRHTSASD